MKKIIFLFFLICLFHNRIIAQEDTSRFEFVQFFYTGGNLSSEGYLRQGQPDGYWKTYHENGNLKSEGNRKDFLLDGVWKFYDSDGKISLEISYDNNVKHGKRITYLDDEKIEENFENDVKQGYTYHFYPEGNLKKDVFFKDGFEEGYLKEYDINGNVITLYEYKKGFLINREIINRYNTAGNKHGLWMEFYESSGIKRTEEWRNGILSGFVKEYEQNGHLKNIFKYVNGELQEDAEELKFYDIRYDYYESGRLKIMGSYRNDLPDGVRREYDELGNIIKGYIFLNGKMIAEGIIDEKGLKQGNFLEYYENGRVKAEGRYVDSKPVGAWKYYYSEGTIEQEGSFDNRGRHDGMWLWYYNNGNVWKKENFENGVNEGEYIEYDISGKVIVKGEYFDGEETGQWLWEIGDTREEGQFVDGQYSGEWKQTDIETDVVIFTGKYLDGYPNGKHIHYWPNGKKRMEGHYIMGQREGEWYYFDSEGYLIVKISYRNGAEQKYNNVVIQPE